VPSAFHFTASPFDALLPEERQQVQRSVDIEYFPAGAVILAPGMAPTHLFVPIKGHVQQWEGDEHVASFGPDDCFDGRGLVAGQTGSRFVASEEVVLYRLPRATVLALIAGNATFGALLFADLSDKLGALAGRRSQHELHALTMARADQAYLRPVHWVDAEDSVAAVARVFHTQRTTNVLVRDTRATPPRTGIFTVTGLPKAILTGVPLEQLSVRGLANFRLVTIRPSTPLFEALALMIRHRIHRLVVAEGEEILGFLQQLDLLSYLSNHSYLITLQILEAPDIPALQTAAAQITRLIGVLDHNGTKVGMIARLVQELNAALFERAWQLIAPADLVANSCLFVMGSEGRGEQLLKTDQDNGLIVRDGHAGRHDLGTVCDRFSAALAAFGYPPCPGRTMVSNPAWRHSETAFADTVRGWLFAPTPDHLMQLAIFLDAHRVAGDASLLEGVRAQVWRFASDHAGTLGRFAGAIDAFSSSGSGWWSRLLHRGEGEAAQIDLKKAGLFPLVHGVRSLAFEHHVAATGTTERIEALCAAGHLPADLGRDLVDSLHVLMGLKLRAGLQALEEGRPASATLAPDRLGTLERDLLKDALAVVRRFQVFLRQHFHLEVLG
jgi:CBS domain-containing protein